jgi:capsular exopolysaccharide synthesis family protein
MDMTEGISQELQQSKRELQHCWLAVKRRWLPAITVFGSMVGCSILVAGLQKPVYTAEGKLLFRLDRTPSLVGVGQAMEEVDSLAPQSNPMRTEMEVLSSTPLVQKAIDALHLKDNQGEPLEPRDFVEKNLQLKVVKTTDVLSLTYKSHNPHEAAAVVNQLMALYIEHSILSNRADTSAAGDFIAKQLPATQAAVRQTEATMRRFREQNHIVDLDKEAETTVAAIANLNNQMDQIRWQLANTKGEVAALRDRVGLDSKTALDLSTVSQSEGVQKALAELQTVEAQLAVQRTKFRASAPPIVSLERQRAALKTVLQNRIGNTLGANRQVPTQNLQLGSLRQELIKNLVQAEVNRWQLDSQLQALLKTQATYQRRAQMLPRLEQDHRELQRQLDAAQSTYQSLLKKMQEVKVVENQTMDRVKVLESAIVPDRPSLKKPILLIALGIVLGSLGAGAAIVWLEVKDDSLKTLRELRDLFGYPLLGVIPAFVQQPSPRKPEAEDSDVPELLVNRMPQSLVSESYRMLQANLKFLISSDQALKVITVTSSVPQEGKSTTVANLAAAIAQLGHRVLLVDADLRHPLQHHIWEVNNKAGLSHMLVGEASLEIAEIAVKTGMTNLDILTAGAVPPNPLALLQSQRMSKLIRSMSEAYDFVIIDSPPLVAAADALALGNLTDGVLVVARPGVVNAVSALTAKESLLRSGQTILGLVVNGVILKNEPDSYFHMAQRYYSDSAPIQPLADQSGEVYQSCN